MDYFLTKYRPKAESYGMKLESTLVSPPVWLKNSSNTVEIVWSMAGFNGWAAMANASRYEPETISWWKEVNSLVISRDRSYFAKESDMEGLNNV